jgi:hypothetical protein
MARHPRILVSHVQRINNLFSITPVLFIDFLRKNCRYISLYVALFKDAQEVKNSYKILVGKPEGRRPREDADVYNKITFNRIL